MSRLVDLARLVSRRVAIMAGFVGRAADDYESAHWQSEGLPVARAIVAAGWRPPLVLHKREDWHEDHGDVVWWWFPIVEPPYVGTPMDSDWPGCHTHWSALDVPQRPPA